MVSCVRMFCVFFVCVLVVSCFWWVSTSVTAGAEQEGGERRGRGRARHEGTGRNKRSAHHMVCMAACTLN